MITSQTAIAGPNRSAIRRRHALVAALFIAFAWLVASAFPRVGVTYDELGHVTSGYVAWKFGDFRINAEDGVLATRASGAPLLGAELKFASRETAAWKQANARAVGYEFFYERGNDFVAMLDRARLATVAFGLGLLWLVWRWSVALFGAIGGIVSLAIAAFSPTLLAHAGLATSDVILTCCLFAALTAWWRMCHRVSVPWVIAAGVSAGCAFTAKMSGVLLVPILAVLLALRCVRPAPLRVSFFSRRVYLRRHRQAAGVLLLSAAIAGVISFGVIWAAYDFRFEASTDSAADVGYKAPWSLVERGATDPNAPANVMHSGDGVLRRIRWVRDHRLLPDAFLWGLAYTYGASREREAFLAGEVSQTGWTSFFPVAFLLKSTPPEILLPAIGVVGLLIRWRAQRRSRATRWMYRASPLLVWFVFYWIVAVNTPLNIGHRHLLPVYPVLFAFAGSVVGWRPFLRPAVWATATILFVVFQFASAFAARPFFLSYFTPVIGGSSRGWHYLVDSSYDWGQGLPDLAVWLKEKQRRGDTTPVFLTYFGSDSPRARQLDVTRFADARDDHGARRFATLTGGWYAISATYFQRLYLDLAGPWFPDREREYSKLAQQLRIDPVAARSLSADERAQLRAVAQRFEVLQFGRLRYFLARRSPDIIVGGSLLLFRLSEAEVRTAIESSADDLLQVVQRTSRGATR